MKKSKLIETSSAQSNITALGRNEIISESGGKESLMMTGGKEKRQILETKKVKGKYVSNYNETTPMKKSWLCSWGKTHEKSWLNLVGHENFIIRLLPILHWK